MLVAGQKLDDAPHGFEDAQVFNPADSAVSFRAFLENTLSPKGSWYDSTAYSKSPPGAMYEYPNVGTALAAFIIERATGTPFEEFTETHILSPLGMTASGWHLADVVLPEFSTLYENPTMPLPFYQTITYPHGGFITSIADLSKFMAELIRGYKGKGTILSRDSYREYFKPRLSAAQFAERNVQNPYSKGYNVGVFTGFGYTGFIGHTGGDPGVLCILFVDPATGLVWVMLFNTSFSDKAGNDAFYAVWNALEQYGRRLNAK